ncbi:MAG TPA: ABC transporter substrate-binding protein [Anaerolineales bacterium]|nr:ABC transporter substrate-binding protein [Anaerolineales bacterium]
MKSFLRIYWNWIIILIVIVGSITLYFINPGSLETKEEPVHIAIVIPEKSDVYFPQQKNVGELFEKEVNRNGGVNGQPIQVDYYYDGSDSPDEARVQALKIVDDDRALVVIGHNNSNSSIEVAPIYDGAGIPSLNVGSSAPAVTQGRPWAFRLINDTTDLGKYAALYAHDVLNYKNASIVYEENPFGTSLADSFQSTFEKNDGTIVNKVPIAGIDGSKLDTAEGLQVAEEIMQNMLTADREKPGLVFLAVTTNAAHEMILANNSLGSDLTMLASYGMGDVYFAQQFDDPSAPDGLYAMTLLNYDVAGEVAQKFYADYIETYPDSKPSWHSGTTYDGLQVALQAIKDTGATGDPKSLKQERENIRKYLTSLNAPNKAVDGVRGQIYFDSNHNFSLPPTIGIFQDGNFIPAPVQLRPVQNKKLVTELSSDVIVDGGSYLYKTNVVYTGIHLNEVTDIDVDEAHVFTADFYIWFRYQGNLDVGSIDFLNAVEPVEIGQPIELSTQNGINYRLYRIRAPFHTTFNLQNYPFDKQELAIQFRHHKLTNEKLIYVEDALGMDQITRGSALLERLESDKVFDLATDWIPSNPRIFIDVHGDRSSFGNPALIGNQQKIESSTFNMTFDIERNASRFMLKNLLPLFFIVALAYVSLFLPEYKFESAISVMTGSLLSVVFFHVNLSSSLNVGYSVMLDYFFYGTYFLFILELITLVVAWHRQPINEKLAYRYIIFARILYPSYILVSSLMFSWIISLLNQAA